MINELSKWPSVSGKCTCLPDLVTVLIVDSLLADWAWWTSFEFRILSLLGKEYSESIYTIDRDGDFAAVPVMNWKFHLLGWKLYEDRNAVDSVVAIHDLFLRMRMNKTLVLDETSTYHCNEQM